MNRTIAANHGDVLTASNGAGEVIIDCKIDNLYYGKFLAVRDSRIPIEKGKITAFIGPSGCGKSTALRCLNRMNDLVRGFHFEGHVHFHGKDIYAARVDPVVVRRHIGMVFQQPNPFAMSIFNNVAFGLRLNRYKGDTAAKVEQALQSAALWDEVKDKLKNNGLSLSGGSAATVVYRPCHCHRAGRPADGRALLRPRPHCHPPHRRAHARAEEKVHHCDRHAQFAAGHARGG
jgi:ABC-type transport system involved in cytochrome bd biosynthesis fused ATPase/permease subunit